MFELSVDASELKDIRKEARYYGLEVSWYPPIGHSHSYPPMDVRWLVDICTQTVRTISFDYILPYICVKRATYYALRITEL